MNKQYIKKLFGLFLIVSVTAVLSSSPAMAKKKHKSKVSAVVVYPTCLRTSDADLSIDQDDVNGIPGPVVVTSASAGEHWIHCSTDLPTAIHSGKGKTHKFYVLAVEVCHSESNGTDEPSDLIGNPTNISYIVQTLVTKLESPSGSEVENVDNTPYSSSASLEGDCLQSPMAIPFKIEGPISIDMKLNLSNGGVDDKFNFGRIRVLLGAKSKNKISYPSQPSQPSLSAPSSPSSPSPPSH